MLNPVILAFPILALIALIQYIPAIIEAVRALYDAIRARNPEQGRTAVSRAMGLAIEMVTGLKARDDLSGEQKREQAVADLIYAAKISNVELTESDARLLVELAVKREKGR